MENFTSFFKKNSSFCISSNELKTFIITFLLLANFGSGQTIFLNNFDNIVNSNLADNTTNYVSIKSKSNYFEISTSNSLKENSSNTNNENDATTLISKAYFGSKTSVNTENELNYIWLNLIGQNEQFCQMALGYRANATNCVDDYDSTRIDGQFTLNSLICADTNDYVIQSRAMPFNPDDSVALSIKIPTEGNCTLFLDHTIGLFSNPAQPIYLYDSLTNTYFNLRLGAYNFHSTNGIFNNRFRINYNSVLSTFTNIDNDHNLLVYKNFNEIVINSSNQIINNVKIFDISGRLLAEKNCINNNEIKLYIGDSKQVVVVKTTLAEGDIISKKVIN